MDEQIKKIMYDYTQALGQQGFYTFDRLKPLVTQESAMELILVEIDKVREMFLGDSLAPSITSIKKLEERLSSEIVEANNKGNFTRVMEIEDDLTAIKRVKSLLSTNKK